MLAAHRADNFRMAVSYTHLDVYKRQVENGALNSCIFPEELRMVQATVEKANAT